MRPPKFVQHRFPPMAGTNRVPDVPTVGEFLPDYEASNWHGIGAPRNTPPEIIGELNSHINVALADPKMKARLSELGGAVLSASPAEFGSHIANETEKWARAVRLVGIKPSCSNSIRGKFSS
jgi:tripartite-type tricarboxylate transporter receptor subunit TctC